MSTAEINNTKLELINWINHLSDIELLDFLKSIKISRGNDDWWQDLSDSDKQSIMKGLQDAKEGKFHESDEFWQKLKNA